MITNRKCYQCGDEDLAEVQARRKAEIRAWAEEQIRAADEALHAAEQDPFEGTIEDEIVQEIPQDQEVPFEEEAQANLDDEEETEETVKEEKKAPAKAKTVAKK